MTAPTLAVSPASSPASSVHDMPQHSHDYLLRLSVEACSVMPLLHGPHYIDHMPLLAAHTIVELLIPEYPARAGARLPEIELAMLKLIRAALFHVLAVQINGRKAAPFDFRVKLAKDNNDDVIPAILASTVCKATNILPGTMREVLWHYLGSSPQNFVFRVRCDPGTDDGVLCIPPSAVVQLELSNLKGDVVDSKKFFSAGAEEEGWTFEQWEMGKGLKAPYVDVLEMMPDNLFEKLNTPVDDELPLGGAPKPLALASNWPPRSSHWSVAPVGRIQTLRATTPVPPALSRCTTNMTNSTIATPNTFGLSSLASPFASPFVACGQNELPSRAVTPESKQPIVIKAAKGSMVRMVRSTAVPIQRYEGGNVFVRGSGLFLGIPESTQECENMYHQVDQDLEYIEPGVFKVARDTPAHAKTDSDYSPGWVRARGANLPPRLAAHARTPSTISLHPVTFQPQQTKQEFDFPAFKPNFIVSDKEERIVTRPVSELLQSLLIPESRSISPVSSTDCPALSSAVTVASPEPSSRLSPCSSASSLDTTASRKRRGRRGGKQLRERKEKAQAEREPAFAQTPGSFDYFTATKGLGLHASDSAQTILPN